MEIFRCPDCECTIEVPDDVEEGNVFSCPDCGLELEYKNHSLVEFTLEGEDWGELIGLFKLWGKPNCYRSWKRRNNMLNIW